MIICCCSGTNETAVQQAAKRYLQGVYTVTHGVIVEIRRSFGDMDKNCGGSCLLEIAKIVTAEAKKMGIYVHENAYQRGALIKTFKNI